jgi:hypothetical protein
MAPPGPEQKRAYRDAGRLFALTLLGVLLFAAVMFGIVWLKAERWNHVREKNAAAEAFRAP